MDTSEFTVETERGPLNCALASPPAGELATDPALLLTFGGARQGVLDGDSSFAPALHFVRAGHRALSFDLPNHGDFVDDYGQSIDGICAAFVAGDDPFARFVANGKAAIDACLETGLAHPGRLFVCGGSRGGYCALRLAAEEKRIDGVADLAPVTDWRILKEFVSVKEREDVAGLALYNWAGELAGRPVYLAIGNHDHRVGTHACVELALRIFEREKPVEEGASTVEIHVAQAKGHALPEQWETEAARFLLRLLDKGEKT
jgi:dienelactone hydrolase